MRSLPPLVLREDSVARARQGKKLSELDFDRPGAEAGLSAWLTPDGELVAIGERDGDQFRVIRGFVPTVPTVPTAR